MAAQGATISERSLGITSREGATPGYSSSLSTVTESADLVAAYAAGITLTQSGCEYAPGAEFEGDEPLTYQTYQALIRPEIYGDRVVMRARLTDDGPFLVIWLNTPGDSDDYVTYILELSMGGYNGQHLRLELNTEPVGMGGGYAASTDLTLAPTSDGTYMALAQIPGALGRAYNAALGFHYTHWTADFFTFNWLNVIAI